MNRHRLDDVALLLAVPGPRRQALRAVAAGIVSTVLLGRTPPRAAAAVCPERVPRPGYRPEVNGCGASGYGWTVPDSWNRAHFTVACNAHDRCYGTCKKNRRQCDVQMRNKMFAACDRAYSRRNGHENLWRLRCRKRATTYFKAVRRFGQSAYEDAQEAACICCNQDGWGPKCGNTCCGRGGTCANPATGTCCGSLSVICGSGCCYTASGCYECVGGQCLDKCEGFDWCVNGVCGNSCEGGCGG